MAIGVFDSGVGGLTVHRRLVDRFPTADFIYLADQANAPYGGRGGAETTGQLAGPVDGVMSEGMQRLERYLETGSAD